VCACLRGAAASTLADGAKLREILSLHFEPVGSRGAIYCQLTALADRQDPRKSAGTDERSPAFGVGGPKRAVRRDSTALCLQQMVAGAARFLDISTGRPSSIQAGLSFWRARPTSPRARQPSGASTKFFAGESEFTASNLQMPLGLCRENAPRHLNQIEPTCSRRKRAGDVEGSVKKAVQCCGKLVRFVLQRDAVAVVLFEGHEA
jgi:hypothetical protein